MQPNYPRETLRIGLLGTGFVAHFHLQALQNVRHVQVAGVYSPTVEHRTRFAAEIDAAGLGPSGRSGLLEAWPECGTLLTRACLGGASLP